MHMRWHVYSNIACTNNMYVLERFLSKSVSFRVLFNLSRSFTHLLWKLLRGGTQLLVTPPRLHTTLHPFRVCRYAVATTTRRPRWNFNLTEIHTPNAAAGRVEDECFTLPFLGTTATVG